jgi:N-hydroxyarylamine O-acetyltransferase
MDRDAYLRRIGYRGELTPHAETLRQLQVAHLRSVPFENLSIHLGESVVLDDNALFDKVVMRRRGGFCYELNGLFSWLLRDLGFDVTMIAAEVMNARGEYGLPFDHMALLVKLEEPWLVDVGFGDSFLEPLRLQVGVARPQGDRTYRIDEEDSRLFVKQREGHSDPRVLYRFDLEPHTLGDYADMCRYHQTSPDSPFTQRIVCSLATADGRVTISGARLIETKAGRKDERALLDEQECAALLEERFGIPHLSPLPFALR